MNNLNLNTSEEGRRYASDRLVSQGFLLTEANEVVQMSTGEKVGEWKGNYVNRLGSYTLAIDVRGYVKEYKI